MVEFQDFKHAVIPLSSKYDNSPWFQTSPLTPLSRFFTYWLLFLFLLFSRFFLDVCLSFSFCYCDVIMTANASQITSLTIVYLTVYSGADERKHQSFAPLAFVRGIHRWPVNSPHKWPVLRKMIPFDDVIMYMYIFMCRSRSYLTELHDLYPRLSNELTLTCGDCGFSGTLIQRLLN